MTYKITNAIILDTKTDVATVRGCYEFCLANSGCASFEHVAITTTCYLYDSVNTGSTLTPLIGTNSGMKGYEILEHA